KTLLILLVETMKKTRRKFNSAFNNQLVLEAVIERESLSELATRFEVHPNIIAAWKRKLTIFYR
ncbi:MAG: transposase, partial [Bacteroidales bacterium]